MGVDRLAPGKSTMSAGAIAAAPDSTAMKPGKSTLSQHLTGIDLADHGAKCDPNRDGSDKGNAGCFMFPEQRRGVLARLGQRITTVQTNYKSALILLKVDELMKKDDELNWMLSLALDVAGAHILGVLTKGLQSAQAAGIAKFGSALDIHNDTKAALAAQKTLASISADDVKSWTKAGFDKAKKGVAGVAKDALNTDDTSKRVETISYISQLTNECDIAFDNFLDYSAAHLNDLELMVLYESMEPSRHQIDTYYDALKAKIDRFHQSGVPQVGRKTARGELGYSDVHRDTRVVWAKDINGKLTLWYQSQDGDFDPGVVKPKSTGSFGPDNAVNAAHLTRPVPEEFQAIALAKSEARWGATPTVDDPMMQIMAREGADTAKMRMVPTPAPMKPMGTLALKPDPTAPVFGVK